MGFYVMTYGGGRYTSVAWTKSREEAQRHVDRIKLSGRWQGMPPKVEPDQSEKSTESRLDSIKPAV